MTARAGYKFITFRQQGDGAPWVFLTLDGPIRMTVGLKPNVWTAKVPYTQFARLAKPITQPGVIELWGSVDVLLLDGDPDAGEVTPDVTIEPVTIVEIHPSRFGALVPGGTPLVLEYELHFADWRDRFTEPRGGRLRVGLVNPGAPEAGALVVDASGKPVKPSKKIKQGLELSTLQMIATCLEVMGVEVVDLPPEDVLPEAPREIEWYGNHAPTELAKLLEYAQCVFVPELTPGPDGTPRASVMRLGAGDEPQFPAGEGLPEMSLPSVDRRGRSIVFASYPTVAVETMLLEGPATASWNAWYVVVLDSDGEYRKPEESKLFKAKGLLYHYRSDFAEIPEQYRALAQQQAYRLIALDPDKFPGNVLTQVIETDRSESAISVRAKIAVRDAKTGLWSNSTDYVEVGAELLLEGRILQLNRPLVRVGGADARSANPTSDRLAPVAVELTGPGGGAAGQLLVRFSIERQAAAEVAKDADPKQKGKTRYVPEYFHCGFRVEADGNVVPMSDDDVQNALDGEGRDAAGGDAIVQANANLRLVYTDFAPQNKTALIDQCLQAANVYLAGSGQEPRLAAGRGFQPIPLSGRVPEVAWYQKECRTDARVMDWYSPLSPIPTGQALRALEAGGGNKYPNQAAVAAQRADLGEGASARSVAPIQPLRAAAEGGGGSGTFTARITAKSQDTSGAPHPKRWVYTIAEQEKTAAGWAGWTVKAGGRTGNAFNKAEEPNGASGLYGNGVNSANLLTGFDIQPIPVGRLVDVGTVSRTDGVAEYWFTEPNAIDGTCA
jgi:hypothetical protein